MNGIGPNYIDTIRNFNSMDKYDFLGGWKKVDITSGKFQVPKNFNMSSGDILSQVIFPSIGGRVEEVYIKKNYYVLPINSDFEEATVSYFKFLSESAGYISYKKN